MFPNLAFDIAAALVSVENEHEILDLAELPESGSVHRKLIGARVPSDADRFRRDSVPGEQEIHDAAQNPFGGVILAKKVECVAGAAIERVLNQIPIGKANYGPVHPARVRGKPARESAPHRERPDCV